MKNSIRHVLFGATALTAFVLSVGLASAMSMKEAVSIALRSNPEIGQAIANREGVQFELEQGLGLFRPRVDLEGDFGGEIRSNATTRANGDNDHLFLRREASVVVRQTLYDGHAAASEVERQASRIDSGSYRVRERSEFIALSVIHEYLEMERTSRVIALAKENIGYHQKILGEIAKGAGGGALSVADRQQAQERVYAAKARLSEIVEEFKLSQATFIKLVGEPAGSVGKNIDVKGKLPRSLAVALSSARSHHPSVKFAQADIDAASAAVRGAHSKFSPNVGLEGRASAAQDVSGIRGFDGDLQGKVVVKWNIYNGGIDKANEQEQIRHVDETFQALHRISREVDEGVRHSWDRRVQQSARLRDLLRDLSAINELRGSYLQQFKIGERSLLDLLDTQNTRFSVQVAIATSDAAVKFSDYRLLASTGDLLHTIGISAPKEAKPYGRKDYDVPETPSPNSFKRIPAIPPLE